MNMTVARSNTSLIDRISAFFAGLNENRRRFRTYRMTIRELDGLSDRELNDLGLHRAEIERVAFEAAYTK